MKLAGPIPGENFTSDTKNYPWHRPPEHTDLDKAIEFIGKRLMAPESAHGILTMLETGMDVATITDIFLTSGIGAGKWTVDFALLLAGPTAHIICLMAEADGIDYDLGVEDKRKKPTSVYLNKVKQQQETVNTIRKEIDLMEVKEKASGGFMGMSRPEGLDPMAQQGSTGMGEQPAPMGSVPGEEL